MSKNKELVRDGFLGDLPEELQLKLMSVHKLLIATCEEVWKDKAYDPIRNAEWAKTAIDEFCAQPSDNSQIGSVRVYKQGKRNSCMIQATGHFINHRNDIDHELLHDFIRHVHQDMKAKVRKVFDLRLTCESEHGEPFEGFDVWTSTKVAKVLWDKFEDKKTKKVLTINESTTIDEVCLESMFNEEDDILFDPFTEANNPKPEYNTDMSEAEAKRTLRTLSQNIINDIENKKDYKVSQYTANIYANIITKNLLPIWGKGFRKFTISLDSYQSFNTFEFKVPKMTQDFVSRFIEGRESINGLIHRNPEIHVKMSPRIFHTMKNPDDAFNFFRAAIKYYSDGLEKYSDKLMIEAMKLNHELKHLIATTKLSGIVTCPMQLLFVFDDVKMDDKETFKISQSDIKTVNQFIRNIYTRYAAPEKEKKQIVDDLGEMIKALKESCDTTDDNIRQLTYLPEAVDSYLSGKFDDQMNQLNERWMNEQCDMDWIHKQKNPEVKYLQEKFGVKKLKKIPADLIAYITIETEAIKDANDKMMIASYTISKLEIVEWYIELLTVGSKKYIVPHTKPYLETVRTQLLACLDKIMKVKIVNPTSRPIIDIQYPSGYEG
jgi:hypothetical protein